MKKQQRSRRGPCKECRKRDWIDQWRVCVPCWKRIFLQGEEPRTEVYLQKGDE